ncbi:MAG: endonuclease III [Christensenellaceae bacterium]|nr:endonuclease III [Christensenellaceae bacterium]
MDKKYFDTVLSRLKKEYGEETSALEFSNPYELLIATILAAQCTDKRVNIVTKDLFRLYPDAASQAEADIKDVEDCIRSCGFYRNKAKNIIACAAMLRDEFGGEVPEDMESLTQLPGVGRKTANVVRAFGFGLPAMPVDTHVGRVARRLGFSESGNPDVVERDLCSVIPEKDWSDAHHWLIWHGRRVCSSQRPKCADCLLNDICVYYTKK